MSEPAITPQRALNVLIDGCNLDLEEGTGVSTYARFLDEALRRIGHRTKWLFGRSESGDPWQGPVGAARRWRHTLLGREAAAKPSGNDYSSTDLYRLAHHRHARLRRFTPVARPPEVDVLHLTTPLPVSMRGVKTVTTIHDLVPILLPLTTPDDKAEMTARLRTSVRKADLVITVSEASKADVCNHLDVAPEKVEVTYQSSDITPLEPYEREALQRVLFRFGLEPQRYVLFVGAIEPKKNIRRLVEAFLRIDTDLVLAVVGKRAWFWEREIGDLERVHGPEKMRRVRFLGYAPRVDLRFLYGGAVCFAFPSLYEGFGLPPLEAMMSGCPVLTSHVASLPEVCGDAALYVDPYNAEDIGAHLERLISQPDLRQRLTQAGFAQAAKFSFDRYVERLGNAYSRLQ